MDAQINKLNGESFTFESYGIIVKDFVVSSIPLEAVYGSVEGSDRRVDYGANYAPRTISIPFVIRARDLSDFPLLRDVLFGLVSDKQSFYIREMRRSKMLAYEFVDTNEPAKMDNATDNKLVGGKRYLVRLQNTFELEQLLIYGEGELEFETTELPYAESIGTTADIQRDGISSESPLWGFGMGLQADDDTLKYTFEGTNFQVYNAGNVGIHPFMQELKVTISNVVGSTSHLELTNKTNGTTFRINEGVSGNQEIVLDGPNVTSNSLVIDPRTTNRGLIQLSPGWNNFEIKGATDAVTAFDFRFYYY